MKSLLASFRVFAAIAALAWVGAVQANDNSASLTPKDRSAAQASSTTQMARLPVAPLGSDKLFAPIGARTSVPIGWVEFCQREQGAQDCRAPRLSAEQARMTDRRWRELQRINRAVNAEIEPVSDLQNYAIEEFWAYPDNSRGDCEDYVLLKRQRLIAAGFPRQSLLITVVRETNGEGHAVLMVRTDEGDFILDNKRDDIRSWSMTGYRMIKRQSQEDPNVWVDLRVEPSVAQAR